MGQSYRQLTLEERRTVFHMKAAKASAQAIAHRLGRHRSTIYRELARNTFQDANPYFNGYFPTVADDAAARKRQRPGKLHRDPKLSWARTSIWIVIMSLACEGRSAPNRDEQPRSAPAGSDHIGRMSFAR